MVRMEPPNITAAPGRAGLTVAETEAVLGCSKGTVYNLLRSGELESFTIGRARRIRPESVAAYVDSHTTSGLGTDQRAA